MFENYIFQMAEDGSDVNTIHTFEGADGTGPQQLLFGPNGKMYVTCFSGGPNGISPVDGGAFAYGGTLSDMTSTGADFKLLEAFDGTNGPSPVGSDPTDSLIFASSTVLFVAAESGGASGDGAIVKVVPHAVPIPFVYALTPETTGGAKASTITVTGGGFIASSQAQLDGADVTTKFVSSSELQVALKSTDVPSGQIYTMSIGNPGQPQASGARDLTVPASVKLGTATAVLDDSTNQVTVDVQIEDAENYPVDNITVTDATFGQLEFTKLPVNYGEILPSSPQTLSGTTPGEPTFQHGQQVQLVVHVTTPNTKQFFSQTVTVQ